MNRENYIIRVLMNHIITLEEELSNRVVNARKFQEEYKELEGKLKLADEIIKDFKLKR